MAERLDGLLTAAGYPHTGWPFISFSLTPILQAAQEEFTRALTSAVQEYGKGDQAYLAAYSSDGLAHLAASLLVCISCRRRNSKSLKMWGEGGRSVRPGSQLIQLPESVVVAHSGLAAYAGREVVVGLRPEHLPAAADGRAGPTLVADADLVEALGAELIVHFTIDARRVRAEGATDADTEAITEAGEGVARVDPNAPVKPGERITFAINADGMQFFDPGSGEAIWAA